MKVELTSGYSNANDILATDILDILDVGVSEIGQVWYKANNTTKFAIPLMRSACYKNQGCLSVYTSYGVEYKFDTEATAILEKDVLKAISSMVFGRDWYIEL